MMGRVKLKILREKKFEWVHFCYLPEDVMYRFEKIFNPNNDSNVYNYWVSKWAEADFGIYLDSWEDLDELRVVIKNMYKTRYPELYLESVTDKQGWTRVWTNNHMEMEIKQYESKR